MGMSGQPLPMNSATSWCTGSDRAACAVPTSTNIVLFLSAASNGCGNLSPGGVYSSETRFAPTPRFPSRPRARCEHGLLAAGLRVMSGWFTSTEPTAHVPPATSSTLAPGDKAAVQPENPTKPGCGSGADTPSTSTVKSVAATRRFLGAPTILPLGRTATSHTTLDARRDFPRFSATTSVSRPSNRRRSFGI
jgi:hypothetical protein